MKQRLLAYLLGEYPRFCDLPSQILLNGGEDGLEAGEVEDVGTAEEPVAGQLGVGPLHPLAGDAGALREELGGMELKDYREKMDAIDDQLLPLFLQRMEVAAEIAAWKKANGIPVLDAGRERAKLRELEEKTPEALRDYTDSLYQTIFELSRSSQTRLLGVTSPLTEAIEKALADTPQRCGSRAFA